MKKFLLLLSFVGILTVSCKNNPAGSEQLVTLNKDSLKIAQFASEQLTITNVASFGANAVFTWSSSDTTIASVSSNGFVKAKTPGKIEIAVSIAGHRESMGVCVVTVTEHPANGILIKYPAEKLVLAMGDVVKDIPYEFDPANTSSQEVVIVRSDSIGTPLLDIKITKAAAAPNGKGTFQVVANKPGNVTFYFQSTADKKKISNAISVAISATFVEDLVWKDASAITVKSGVVSATDTIIVRTNPLGAQTGKIAWKSADESKLMVISLNDSTAVLKGMIENGKPQADVSIYAGMYNGLVVTRSIKVTPADAPVPPTPTKITAIKFTKDTIWMTFDQLLAGKTDLFSYLEVAPKGAIININSLTPDETWATTVGSKKNLANLALDYIRNNGTKSDQAFIGVGQMTSIMEKVSNGGVAEIAFVIDTMVRHGERRSAATSLYDTLFVAIASSPMVATDALLKATYSFTEGKYTLGAYIHPFLTHSYFKTPVATVYKPGAKKGDKDVIVESFNLVADASNMYYSGKSKAFASAKPLDGYYAIIEFNYNNNSVDVAQNFKIMTLVEDNGSSLAPRPR